MSFVNVFQYVLISYSTLLICRRSSVVEHTLGKGGVGSSILLGGTIFFNNYSIIRLSKFLNVQKMTVFYFLSIQIKLSLNRD